MVCVSHFDKDHISGIELLLREVKTDVIVLPYMPLAQRIAILVEEDADGWYADFLIDPAAYLLGIANDDQTRLIYIAGGDGGAEPPPDFEPPDEPNLEPDRTQPDGDNDDESLSLDFPTGQPVSDADGPGLAAQGLSARAAIVTHDSPFNLGSRWEFVFYNEARPEKSIDPLQNAVVAILNTHRNSDGKYDSKPLLDALKNEYVKTFDKGGKNANRISLVMYSGPLKRASLSWNSFDYHDLYLHLTFLHHHLFFRFPRSWQYRFFGSMLEGTLLTGDIFFKKPTELQAAKDHFSVKRWKRVQVLQVPHHGSDENWHVGAASDFSHRVSVYSAKLGSVHHPGNMVKTDLASYGPTFVSEASGLVVTGMI